MKTLKQIYSLLREGKDKRGLSILNQSLQTAIVDGITAQLLIVQFELATGKTTKAVKMFSRLERNLKSPIIPTLPKHALLRYLRIKFFLKDFCLPKFTSDCCKHLGADLPLWVDYYFQINQPMRSPALLDFGSFYFLPIPKNASSSIGSHWCSLVLREKTVNPHRYYPNPFFETTEQKNYLDTSNKPVVCVLRNEDDRKNSYYRGNVIKRKSLVKDPNADRFMGLKVRPSYNEFCSDVDLYKLIFDDTMHHLLPSEAYLKPFEAFQPLIVDFGRLDQLESLYPNIFPTGHFSNSHLMIGG